MQNTIASSYLLILAFNSNNTHGRLPINGVTYNTSHNYLRLIRPYCD